VVKQCIWRGDVQKQRAQSAVADDFFTLKNYFQLWNCNAIIGMEYLSTGTSTSDLFYRVLAQSGFMRVLLPNRIRFQKVVFQGVKRGSETKKNENFQYAFGSLSQILAFHLTPPTNYRTEFGYVLRCAEELTEDTPQIESHPWSLSTVLLVLP
jgi:hypothetical protein